MNKKGLLLTAVALVVGCAAYSAAHTSAGCGWGTKLFEGKNTKTHLVLAATTNGSFGNQTFGISSETIGCTSSGVVMADKKTEAYAEANLSKLSQEMAQGGGEYVDGLAGLMGVNDKAAFSRLTQQRYEKLFPSADTDAAAMLRNLRAELAVSRI